VHRDISPSNVLISYDGAVMVTDFGIAKATNRTTQTTTGTVRGKLAYMSPEQCRGMPLDRRSDIFAIGTLMHELSTGKSLFGGTSDFDVMKAIVEDPVPPPSAHVAGYPSELDRVVLKALARDPADRYATARELQLDLERFAVEHKLPISSARLAGFMQQQFAERIASWRERVALDYAARSSSARPPSADVEIIAVEAATEVETPRVPRPRRRARAGVLAGVAAAAAIVVIAQRELSSSHAATVPVASASAAAPEPIAPEPIAPEPIAPTPIAPATQAAVPASGPVPGAADEQVAVLEPRRASEHRASLATAPPIRHRRHHHSRASTPAPAAPAAAKVAPAQHPPSTWNPEDGLPPGAH
jgi:hypothetical protein